MKELIVSLGKRVYESFQCTVVLSFCRELCRSKNVEHSSVWGMEGKGFWSRWSLSCTLNNENVIQWNGERRGFLGKRNNINKSITLRTARYIIIVSFVSITAKLMIERLHQHFTKTISFHSHNNQYRVKILFLFQIWENILRKLINSAKITMICHREW